MRKLLVPAAALIVSRLATPVIALPQSSTFETSLDGWTLVDADGNSAQGTLFWQATGGNPGGFAFYRDFGSDGGFISAPSAYLGDWSELNGTGELRYEHRIVFMNNVTAIVPYEVRIAGTGGQARYLGGISPGPGSWVQVTVPINEIDWTVTTGTWAGILSGVTNLRIRIEQVDGNDHDGIDNVWLGQSSTSIPVITSAGGVVLVILLMFLGALRIRRGVVKHSV